MQMQTGSKAAKQLYKNDWECFTQILKNEGIRGINKGMVATIVREVPAYAGQFTTYELIKGHFLSGSADKQMSPAQQVFTGGVAGLMCWVCSYPQDIIKTKL